MPHLNDIFRTALRVTGDRSAAEDVIQEVYLQAWRSFDRFEEGTNCRAWLYKILFHCVSHQRRKWFRFPRLNGTEELLEANLRQPESVPQNLTDEDILAALDGIAQEFRAVVVLVDVEEFAYKEVGEILSIPIGTVMSRLSRGRAMLRKRLAGVARSYGLLKSAPDGGAYDAIDFRRMGLPQCAGQAGFLYRQRTAGRDQPGDSAAFRTVRRLRARSGAEARVAGPVTGCRG